MTGSHEVEGSIPFSSTKIFKGLWQMQQALFLFWAMLGQFLQMLAGNLNPVKTATNGTHRL